MPFSLDQYATVSLILLGSSVVQGAVGFAAALFGIPLLVLSGISFPDAVAIILVASAPQNMIPAWRLREHIDFRVLVRPVLIRYAFLPLGVAALWLVGQGSKSAAAQLVGVIVLVILAVQWNWQTKPQPRLHPGWEWLAFGLAGFLLGLCAMGGPPMVLWVLAHDWPMNRARAFLFFIFSTALVPQALLMWLFFGNQVFAAMLLSAACFPAVLAGLWLGLYLSKLAPDRMLRRLSVALLLCVAVSAIVMPYVQRAAGH